MIAWQDSDEGFLGQDHRLDFPASMSLASERNVHLARFQSIEIACGTAGLGVNRDIWHNLAESLHRVTLP